MPLFTIAVSTDHAFFAYPQIESRTTAAEWAAIKAPRDSFAVRHLLY
jgi:hypothetical protein